MMVVGDGIDPGDGGIDPGDGGIDHDGGIDPGDRWYRPW